MTALLPRSSTTAWEDALESAISRISQVPVPIASIKQPQETDPRALTALGWEWSVNEWQSAWADQRKRDVVDASPEVHRHLGTAGAVRSSIAALGYAVTMQEWFEYAGEPYTFRILVDLDQQSLDRAAYLMLQRTALDAKNVRSFFAGFLARSVQPGRIRYGFGLSQGATALYQPLVPPVYETRVRVGTGIAMADGAIKATYQPLG